MNRNRISAGLIGILAMMVVLASCSTTSNPAASASRRPSDQPSATAAGGPGTTTPSPKPGSASPGPVPSGSASPYGSVSGSSLRLEVRMAPCIERGRVATATIVTAPGTMLGASATYADGDAHGNYWLGVADVRGEYPVTWTPPPEAPLGPGKFLVGATSETYGGNTLIKEFRLAGLGGCA